MSTWLNLADGECATLSSLPETAVTYGNCSLSWKMGVKMRLLGQGTSPGDEMFSDIYKTKEVNNDLCFEIEGKTITRREGDIDDALIGGNASTEYQDKGAEGTTVSGVNIVMNRKLQETGFTKEFFKQYIKEYLKALKC